jgi:hypothetical protein
VTYFPVWVGVAILLADSFSCFKIFPNIVKLYTSALWITVAFGSVYFLKAVGDAGACHLTTRGAPDVQ